MSDPLYISRSRIEKGEGRRIAYLEAGPVVEFGVHGAIKQHYKLDHLPAVPLPVDYIVAATGG